jgi:hypothetical protein
MREPSVLNRATAVLLAALGGMAAAGCAQTRWENPAVDAATTASDQAECEQTSSLAARQQVMFERLSGPRLVRGGVIGYPRGTSGFQERNSEWFWTQQFFDACMRNKGYRLVRVQ